MVGGYDGQTYLDKVHAYDPHTNEWNQVREDNYYHDVQYMCVVCWFRIYDLINYVYRWHNSLLVGLGLV